MVLFGPNFVDNPAAHDGSISATNAIHEEGLLRKQGSNLW